VIAGCRGVAVVVNNDSEDVAEWRQWAGQSRKGCHVDNFTVLLIDPTGESEPEIVFENPDRQRVTQWVRRWLEDHIGLAIAIFPPGVPVPREVVKAAF
jgi:hypothetical protein